MMTITEELLMLALHDNKGTIVLNSTAYIPYGLSTAMLYDLIKLNKIAIVDGLIEIIEFSPTGYDFFDKSLIAIREKHKKDIKHWINKFSMKGSKLRDEIYNRLVLNGILQRKKKKLAWVIAFERYPTLNPIPELMTRKLIHDMVFENLEIDNDNFILISLLHHCNLINEVFPKEQRKEAKKRIKTIIKESKPDNTIKSLINDLEQIIFAIPQEELEKNEKEG